MATAAVPAAVPSRLQQSGRLGTELGEGVDAHFGETGCGDGPDAGQRGDGQRVEERLLLFAADDAHALWFRGCRGELRQEF